MKQEILQEHLKNFIDNFENNEDGIQGDFHQKKTLEEYYQENKKEDILAFEKEEFNEYVGNLSAAKNWGNKENLINKLIDDNGFEYLKEKIAEFIWGEKLLENRWDEFRREVKGIGPALMSELLCLVYPKEYMIWNRDAFVAFDYLDISDLPRYNYQCTGKKYLELCEIAQNIAREMKKGGLEETDLILLDLFFKNEFQLEKGYNRIHINEITQSTEEMVDNEEQQEFIHQEIKEKISEVGEWLGFNSEMNVRVANGSQVDVVWKAKIGNMGRLMYVFEVQDGNIDRLILNLLKSLNNPAVQGVVAVSDEEELEKIKRQAREVGSLEDKLEFWDFREVMDNHDALSFVNESINKLGLVPKSI